MLVAVEFVVKRQVRQKSIEQRFENCKRWAFENCTTVPQLSHQPMSRDCIQSFTDRFTDVPAILSDLSCFYYAVPATWNSLQPNKKMTSKVGQCMAWTSVKRSVNDLMQSLDTNTQRNVSSEVQWCWSTADFTSHCHLILDVLLKRQPVDHGLVATS